MEVHAEEKDQECCFGWGKVGAGGKKFNRKKKILILCHSVLNLMKKRGV
jgi:hypothetical protein